MPLRNVGVFLLAIFLGTGSALAEIDAVFDVHVEGTPRHDHPVDQTHHHGDSDDHHHSQDGDCQHQTHCCCQHPATVLASEDGGVDAPEDAVRYACRSLRLSAPLNTKRHFHPPRA